MATALPPDTTMNDFSATSNNNEINKTWLERNSPTTDISKALLGTGTFCGGIINDYKERLPYLKSDYVDGISWKTLSAAIFMFCATVTVNW